MAILCPVCGKTSQDVEFCDHCNADFQTGPKETVPLRCPVPNRGMIAIPDKQAASLTRPETYIVLRGKTEAWRAHWVFRSAWPTWRDAVEHRIHVQSTALPPVQLIEDEAGYWVIVEHVGRSPDWQGNPSHENGDSLSHCKQLQKAARRLATITAALHSAGLVWLNFDPRELEPARDSETWRITNCDLRVFEAGPCPSQVSTRPSFAAPEIVGFHTNTIGPWTDAFHVALFCYYWLAKLLPGGFPGNGLQAFDYTFPPLRTFAPDMPPGLADVIRRGLAVEPDERFATPGEFVDAFDAAVERATHRYRANISTQWEIGASTDTGRAKRSLQRENEDGILVKRFAKPERALVSVADGVTTCYVGSGALASYLTCETLNHEFNESATEREFEETINRACSLSSDAILQWALQHGYRDQLQSGVDLMGSTLCAGWLENSRLSLANVGDSRAYLITDDFVEQLTVDGDMAGEMFLSGMPPEDVRQMGGMSRALRDCIGGCKKTADGGVRPLNAHQPQLSRWPLLPGDCIVLCSDGLVDEGVFLEPDQMAEFIRSNRDQTAQEIAENLTSAADDLQRVPSAIEPDGFGDNITCVFVRISATDQ